jgi:hypothetical protein
MDIENLSLEEMFELESKHFPLAGDRRAVFLEPSERSSRNLPVASQTPEELDSVDGKLSK